MNDLCSLVDSSQAGDEKRIRRLFIIQSKLVLIIIVIIIIDDVVELFIYSFLNYFYFQGDDQLFCNPVGKMETKVSPQIITGDWCITVVTVPTREKKDISEKTIYISSAKS